MEIREKITNFHFMLIEFSVGNYRSFKDIQTLHLQAANITSKDKILDKHNVFSVNQKLSLLKSKAIYGANASGKSNIVLALRDFKSIIRSSLTDEHLISSLWLQNRFRLSENKDSDPMFFQIIFTDSGTIYRYGFGIHNESIISEWLYGVPREKEVYFFEREGLEVRVNENQFREGKRLIHSSADNIPLFRLNSLFISVVAAFNGRLAQSLIARIQSIILIPSSFSDGLFFDRLKASLENDSRKKKINAIMKSIDSGIEWINVANIEGPVALDLDERKLASIKDQVLVYRRIYNEAGETVGTTYFFLENEEAEGNKKLVMLSPFIMDAIEKGIPMVIDEFDAHLHPNLTRRIVELFQNPITNPKNAQLIFASHDSNLLDATLLRRDQICFVEKNKYGASRLINLAEYKGVRNDGSYEKDYLKGKYGAIPYLGRFEQAFEN